MDHTIDKLRPNDLKIILDITTSALYKSGGREMIIIGAIPIIMYTRGTTSDVDIYLTDINIAADSEIVQKHLRESAKIRGCQVSEIKHTIRLSYFYITIPGRGDFKVELMNDTDTKPDTDTALRELGTSTYCTMNGVDIRVPTPEASFIMKLSTYGPNRPKDKLDLKRLYPRINKDIVRAYVFKYDLQERYRNMFRNSVSSYQTIYQMALMLPDKTLRIALRRLNYPIPGTHESKADLYARHYLHVKRLDEIPEFKGYLKYMVRKKRRYRKIQGF